MVATSYFIIARATLTPTPHSLLFISHRYTGQTEGESMIKKKCCLIYYCVGGCEKKHCVHLCVSVHEGLSLSHSGLHYTGNETIICNSNMYYKS